MATNDNSSIRSNQSHAQTGRGGNIVGGNQHNNTTNNLGGMVGHIDLHNRAPVKSQTDSGGTGKTRILMLAANPSSTPRLALDVEAREITDRLQLAQARESFDLITYWAVRPVDVFQQLNQHRPHIVHFSGHGNRSGEIVLSTSDRDDQFVSMAAMAEVFRTVKEDTRMVVLNACYSTLQAHAISQHIDYVIGMRAPIDDKSAAIFAAAFYSALAFQRTVAEAFDQAKVAIELHRLPGHSIPELIVRPGARPYPFSP
ncbi:CHAT domain-containing protein [Dactylosporangium sp. CA-139066]|uniref:CHAT domain-containing protein n=1 Tax=Dactylosporangium sp. CA-139066 TaxID=3239930 RepID=UPI003D93F49C